MKLKIALHIIIMLLLVQATAFAQREAENWFFGNFAGLNFSTGLPVSIPNGQIITTEGVATISDANGKLLFYTDGITVWNQNHTIMPNGTGLYGHVSSSQSAVIVPMPLNDSIYYIFTVTAQALPQGLCYSIVNIKSNGGQGAVITKNVQLLTPACEQLTAVKHCNNQDFWVVARQYNGSNYYSWKVTAAGVSATPVTSVTSNYIGTPFYDGSDAIGCMKISPDGSKIAATHQYYNSCEFGKFDNSTGIISDMIKISQIPPVPGLASAKKIDAIGYGVEFSADSKLLYLDIGLRVYSDDTIYITYNVASINQYNISVHDSAQIAASHYFARLGTYVGVGEIDNALQLAPDGKIYKTEYFTNKLTCINNPNVQGSGCNYQFNAVNLDFGASTLGLPNFVTSFLNKRDFTTTGNCSSNTTDFKLVNNSYVDSVRWNFDDIPSGVLNYSTVQNPTHIFSTSGNHQVKVYLFLHNGCGNFTDSIVKNIFSGGTSALKLGNDTTICKNDIVQLRSNVLGASYLWSTGATDSLIRVTAPGNYALTVTIKDCNYSDSIKIQNFPLPQFSLGNDTLICGNSSLVLTAHPVQSSAAYLWNTNARSSSIVLTAPGKYWLQVTDNNSCSSRDTINVSFKQLPNFSLGKDTAICEGETFVLNAAVTGATSYVWSTGETTPVIQAYQQKVYWCDVTKDGCAYRDSLYLLVKPLPVVKLGSDTVICEDKTYLLDVTNANSTYVWQDNTISPVYEISKAGEYKVTVTMNGCKKSDTTLISYQLKPKFNLGKDTFLCAGTSYILNPVITAGTTAQPLTYEWQNGSTGKSFTVSTPGLYRLEVSNYCGVTADEISITQGVCEIYMPGAFSPDNDRRNDVFKVLYGENISAFTMQIFNRYGEKVFETSNKNNGWNGMYKGVAQPLGAYVWLINFRLMNDTKEYFRKGTVVLIR